MLSIYEDEFPEIFASLREDKISIYYDSSRRSFSIGGIDSPRTQEITFCPWTGKSLPKSLAGEFSARLESLGLSSMEIGKWPEEWRSEAWWIKEGL